MAKGKKGKAGGGSTPAPAKAAAATAPAAQPAAADAAVAAEVPVAPPAVKEEQQQVAPKVVELNGSSAGETEASPDVKSEVTEEASQVEAAEDTAGTSASEAAAETEAAPEGAPEGGSSEEEKVADGTTEGEEGGDDLPLYPMPVKGPGGEEIELQVNPGDTVLDIRQFLADAPETCFYTCYDLIMTTADGIRYHLVDYIEIGDVTDIPAGGCSLEMYSGLYDDRAMRFHVRKARDLVSLAACYTSPSTILAAEYELAQAALLEKEGSSGGDEAAAAAARKKQQEEPKELPAELEQLGFVDNAAGLLPALAPKPILESSGCLESIAFSSFNPVPGYRRLQGDLMYFELTTVEGASFCLTGHTRGFFVNQSKGSILNPKPAEPKQEATTLVGLLRILSPKFVPAFAAVIEKKATLHPFENMSPAIPPNAWLGPHPLPEHTRDIARAEDALISPYGAEITGIQRDWNEELQSCRELPKATAQDRLIRDRALYRITCEFIDAAVKGAKAVIGRAIPPINPPDPDRFHMWVHNGIFFSMAVDGDFVMLQQIREQELQQQAAAAAAAGGGEEAGKKGAAADKEVVAAKKAAEEEAQAEAEKKRAAEAEEEEKKKEEAAAAEKQKKGGGKKGKKGAKEAPTPAPAAKAKEEPAAPAATAAAAAVEEAAVPAEGEEAATGEGAKEEGAAGQVAESEQATYASANNDLKGTKLLNGADVPGLFTLAMTIVDYRGHRVIAQSIIPGILYGDKTASMMYGSVDNGKHIKSTDKFHSKVLEAGEMLHIKEHEVEDSEGAVAKICAPVEVKGIRGSDERQYLLDLMRLTPRDANFTGAGSRHCVVRPELVSSFCQIEEVERYMAAEGLTEQPEEEKLRELRENKALPQIRFNVNVLTDFKLKGDAQELEEDVALVKKVGDFLTEKAIPGLVADFRSLELSPMDGQTLTEAFHSRGINMRYLGKVAAAAKDLPHIYQLCLSEMVVRSTKHVLKAVLRETMDQDVGGAIAHFFNCFLGTSTSVPPQTELGFSWAPAPVAAADAAGEKGAAAAADDAAKPAPEAPAGKAGKKGKGKKGGAAAQEKAAPAAVAADGEKKAEAGAAADATEAPASAEESAAAAAPAAPTPAADERPGYTRITADMVWSDITEGVKFKYQYELPADVRSAVRHLSTLRNACLKLGVVMAGRDYELEGETPFALADIQDMQPVVKHAAPVCADAQQLMTRGRRLMDEVGLPADTKPFGAPQMGQWLRQHQGKLNEAFEAFNEAFTLLQNVTGPLHRDVATCCRRLAMVLYHAGDPGSALLQEHRELIVNERILGPDHPHTAHSYGHMALFYHALSEPELSLRHLAKTLQLLGVTCGPRHPDTAATFINMAMTYQDAGKLPAALRYLQEALVCSEKLLGESHLQTAVCHHALALAFFSMGAFKLSLQQEKKAHAILEKQLGQGDARTRDSEQWMQTFVAREVQKQQSAQNASHQANAMRLVEALRGRPELLQALQQAGNNPEAVARVMAEAQRKEALHTAPGGAGAKQTAGGGGRGLPQATPGMRTRGVDERAAKATAEARRKAAARGVNLRAPTAPAARAGAGSAAAAGASAGKGAGEKSAVNMDELISLLNASAARSGGAAASAPASASASAHAAASKTGSSSSGSSAASAASAASSSSAAGVAAGLGTGLGVGLGAISGGAPPKGGAAGKKVSGAAPGGAGAAAANGVAGGADAKSPKGLGGGLVGLEPPKKSKSKGKKGGGNGAAAASTS